MQGLCTNRSAPLREACDIPAQTVQRFCTVSDRLKRCFPFV
ncbi:hypothetical protein HMPREF6485_2156 [Segatella buccae ATCC 33574]|uniref:Uncharacterized protein n=1 Tax=Segatella buccae ATCC 33574 TaxID=873513 RepID=E6K970_9BACT|nr:hypothetical protein HMPREF0649_02212 [Segatella buccae D17]EFU29878.1 hypothetical protein HMPREF6485_2156 [Segatella buccae ATCC 33574]